MWNVKEKYLQHRAQEQHTDILQNLTNGENAHKCRQAAEANSLAVLNVMLVQKWQ